MYGNHICELAVHIYDFHISTVIYSSLHGFTTKQHNDQLPVGLLAQLLGTTPVSQKSWVQISYKPEFFFRPYFQQASQVVFIATKITFIFNINSIDETKLSCCIAPPN